MIPVLYQDAHLLAVDKPAGRLVIPGRGRDEPSLVQELSQAHGRLWVVHRLDRGTSGVVVFARTAQAHRALNLAFDRGEPSKRYLAMVSGTPPLLDLDPELEPLPKSPPTVLLTAPPTAEKAAIFAFS